MIRPEQFSLISVQAVIFTSGRNEFSQSSVLVHMLTEHADLFNGEVQTIPAFAEKGTEINNIPRIILQSQDAAWRLQAGSERTDLFWYKPATVSLPSTRNTEEDNQIISQCVQVLEKYVRATATQIRVGRLALVLNRLALMDKPQQELIKQFCDEHAAQGPFRNSKAFEVHNLKSYELGSAGTQVNSWMRCKSVDLQPLSQVGVLVEQDINMVPEGISGHHFNGDRIGAWFSAVQKETDRVLEVYFPEED